MLEVCSENGFPCFCKNCSKLTIVIIFLNFYISFVIFYIFLRKYKIINNVFGLDLFDKANVNEYTYKINNSKVMDEEKKIRYNLAGKIVGKAIFERIPINIYLDRTLIRNILKQKIVLDDFEYFDQQVNY